MNYAVIILKKHILNYGNSSHQSIELNGCHIINIYADAHMSPVIVKGEKVIKHYSFCHLDEF